MTEPQPFRFIEITGEGDSRLSLFQSTTGVFRFAQAKERLYDLIHAMSHLNIASSLVDLNRRFGGMMRQYTTTVGSVVSELEEEKKVLRFLYFNKTWLFSAAALADILKDVPPEDYYNQRQRIIDLMLRRGADVSGFEFAQVEARRKAGVKKKRKVLK